MSQLHNAAEHAARTSYGRLLAFLAYRWRDLAVAEDALAEAFASALVHWPQTGVPDSPDAWLMTAAKRNLLQMARHAQVETNPSITILLGDTEAAAPEVPPIPDERLKLLFVCAHPAIDPSIHTALMLQTVLGLDAKRIASAFLLSPTAMAQRLVRAKTKITRAGIRFEEPQAQDLAERTQAVLEAIYASYSLGWDALPSDALVSDAMGQTHASGLVDEAIYLADLTASLLPESAEAAGLLALLLLCESRRQARHNVLGEFVPLHEQDASQWNMGYIKQADLILQGAAAHGEPGAFQLEAAIQAAHCERVYTGIVPWRGIAALYERLIALAPTTGAQVSRAVALAEAGDVAQGLAVLRTLNSQAIASYQPYWVALAHLQSRSAQMTQALASYSRALGLTTSPAVRAYLQRQIDQLARA